MTVKLLTGELYKILLHSTVQILICSKWDFEQPVKYMSSHLIVSVGISNVEIWQSEDNLISTMDIHKKQHGDIIFDYKSSH